MPTSLSSTHKALALIRRNLSCIPVANFRVGKFSLMQHDSFGSSECHVRQQYAAHQRIAMNLAPSVAQVLSTATL